MTYLLHSGCLMSSPRKSILHRTSARKTEGQTEMRRVPCLAGCSIWLPSTVILFQQGHRLRTWSLIPSHNFAATSRCGRLAHTSFRSSSHNKTQSHLQQFAGTKQNYDLTNEGLKSYLQNKDIAINKIKADNTQLKKELEQAHAQLHLLQQRKG